MNLKDLVASVIADGVIDATEVQQIKDVIYADGVIDTDEVKALFEMNDACSGNANAPEWTTLFTDAISANILADGTIDQDETDLLVEMIGADGQTDATEYALLKKLEQQVETMPTALADIISAYETANASAVA